MENHIPKRPPGLDRPSLERPGLERQDERLLNSQQTMTQSLSREQMGSYAEFREREFRPLQDKLFAAIYPILSANEHAEKLNEGIRHEFMQALADRLTSEYFSKSFDYLKKQQKQEAIETAQRQIAYREAQIKAMRNVSIGDFRARIMVSLDSLVK